MSVSLTATQQHIAHLRHHLYAKTLPVGGMPLFEYLHRCNLSGAQVGLEQLDKMFAALRKHQISFEKICQRQGYENFFISIAIYLADMIAKQLDDVPVWLNFEELQKICPNLDATNKFEYALCAQFGYGACLPLGAIKMALEEPFSLVDYVKLTASDISAKSRLDHRVSANEICLRYLKKVRTGKLIDTTIAYRERLAGINFDYSYYSLVVIDNMLAKLSQDEHLTADSLTAFMSDFDKQAFVFLLTCYVGMTIAQSVKVLVQWKHLNTTPNATWQEYQVMFLDQTARLHPLMVILNRLFGLTDNDHPHSVVQLFNDTKAHLKPKLSFFPRGISDTAQLPKTWSQAMRLAGQLGVWQMVRAAQGEPLKATSLSFDEDTQEISFIEPVVPNEQAVFELFDKLEVWQDKKIPYQFISYDVYADLPTGRTDGVAIEVRVFDKPLKLQLILPYRRANHPLGFAIYPLVCSQYVGVDVEMLSALMEAFYQGAIQVHLDKSHDSFWQSYYLDWPDIYQPSVFYQKHPLVAYDKNLAITLPI